MADTELNISPDEKVAGVPLARLLRNLDETSYNEGSDALACRLTDCKAVIEELLQQRALASRPAEVDDEGLPPWPDSLSRDDTEHGVPYFSAEQYRQGQRDAVAADRARMPDPKEISDAITEAYNVAYVDRDWKATDYWRGLGKRFSAWAAPAPDANKKAD